MLSSTSTSNTENKNTIKGYARQSHWREFMQHLPSAFQLTDAELPAESYYPWKGHHIHLDRFENPHGQARIILLHGVGTNGRQMSLIVGAPLAQYGYDVTAIDLPGYGVSAVNPKKSIAYHDWVDLVDDFINAALEKDKRPIFLYGLSAGGMLAYHVAAQNQRVAGIIGMTFLDQRHATVRDGTAFNLFMSRIGVPSAHLVANTPLGNLKLPMRLASKMHTLVNDPFALKTCLADPSAAGNWVSVRFLDSYMHYQPKIEPKDFNVCPILLTQPEEDRWTPLALSEPVIQHIHHVPVEVVILKEASHLPIESIGLIQLHQSMHRFMQSVLHLHSTGEQPSLD